MRYYHAEIKVLTRLIVIVLMMLGVQLANAEDFNSTLNDVSDEVKNLCIQAKKHVISPSEMPQESIKAALNNCNSVDLYYGFEKSPDYNKAKNCAFIHDDYDVLTMIYANGNGARRDLDRALYYACQMNAAPAEMEGRVLHLNQMKTNSEQNKPFDVCDDITSGYMMGWCASIDQGFANAKQHKKLAELVKNWSSTEQDALKKLQLVGTLYFNARKENEIDHTGTARAAFEISEEIALNQRFIDNLIQWSGCQIPLVSEKNAFEADQQLNAVYNKVLQSSSFEYTTLTQDGIKTTERAWIRYRDAWAHFGQIKCPKIPEQTWKTLITKERIKELETLI